MFEQLGLIGCGLMGGSFALALKRAGLVKRVVGYSKSPSTTERARQMGVIDVEAPSALLAVSGADIVLLAVPVSATEASFKAIRHLITPNTLVMDVGSTKRDVVDAARRVLRDQVGCFVPAHPITGKEVSGVEHADVNLYNGKQVILTPIERTFTVQLQKATMLWTALGCDVVKMSPQAHDAAYASVSHLPHLIAFALMNGIAGQEQGKDYLSLAGPGFRDFTRIAASDPKMWRDVLIANKEELLAQSKIFQQSLHALEKLIAANSGDDLEDQIEKGQPDTRELADFLAKTSEVGGSMFDVESLDIPPLARAGGQVRLPGSKSISNRVLLLAALSHGDTVVHDLLASDDTAVMLAALRQLGCGVEQRGQTAVITGMGGRTVQSPVKLFMGNAGTAMRPLTAALALIGGEFELSGVPRMHERPIGDLVDALRQLGCVIDYLGNEGFPPLRLRPGQLKLDAPIKVRGDVSSQFLTALLMALPLVARRDIRIEVVGELISRPYIEITLNLLDRFGIQVKRERWESFTIPAGSQYRSPGEIHVEGDASSASYFIALGAIAPARPGHGGIELLGVGAESMQGDIRFVEAARAMGAKVESRPNSLLVSRGAWPLKAIDLDCNHIPDAAMTLAVMALYADGKTTLRNIASWRVKETDRIAAMTAELQKLGAVVEEGADYLAITPPASWKAASIHTYDDHRVAMCFSLAAFNPAQLPVRILDPKCVGKTFPDYFESFLDVCEAEPGQIPVICVDGPTASGKGTLAARAALKLGYHYLDSGALYRLSAHAAQMARVSLDDAEGVAAIARILPVHFRGEHVFLRDMDVSEAIRTEAAGMAASKVSAHPEVRAALLELQHGFRRLPGLVADGRDMGTVVFPDAPLKVFLTASAQHRAERRHKQLISKGIPATIAAIQQDLEARDARDSSRKAAPLKPADDARLLDNSDLSIEKSVDQVIAWWQATRPF